MVAKLDRLFGRKIADRYCITGEIGAGAMGRVFRALSFDDPSQDVAIKVITRDRRLDSEDLLRFQKEAALMSRLHHPNIICFHELGLLDGAEGDEDLGSGYYIVMEIANGITLKESLARDGRKDLAFFFQLGLQITAALDYTHTKNIIHRDIKPQNIVVGKASRDQRGVLVKVLDFGVARLDEAMNHSGGGKNSYLDVAGTPLYMAPEQTNLLEAPIDHRVDLYSLGCVLYEILAGRPPFSGTTREKLARQHVYDQPESLTAVRPDVPPIIEKIVHKLLAKHPDERYQTAFALHSDLQRAKRRLERRDRPAAVNFSLALNDRFQGVSARLELVGRQSEMQALIDSYSVIAQQQSRSRMAVIKGGPGTGKTRILAEFRNYLAERKIRFVSANFSQHENNLQFNALANGFNDYLLRIRKSQPHEAEELRRKVKTLLGMSAHEVAAIVPGLKPFVEDIPSPPAESGDEFSFQTFAKAFSDFTRCLAVDQHPVVFIFDDLQWADDNSLELIDQFFSHNNSQRFFLVVTHRPVENIEGSHFGKLLDKFRKLRRRYDEVELGNFSLQDVRTITENLLMSPESVSDELVAYISERSRNNPLYVVELVRTLVSRDLIYLRTKNGHWEFDMDVIRQASVQVESVDLILSRTEDLEEFDRRILQIAAAIGLTFPFELLQLQGGDDGVRVMASIKRAVNDGLVARAPDDPELAHLGKSFVFTHWRARDSIYKTLSREELIAIHLAVIARLEHSLVAATPKTIFALAHHMNRAIDAGAVLTEDLRERGIRHNQAAGAAAWEVGAIQSAQRYFEQAYALLAQNGVRANEHPQAPVILEALADISAEQRHHGSALTKYRELLSMNRLPPTTRAAVAYKNILIQMVGGVIGGSRKDALHTLRQMRMRIPAQGWQSLLPAILSVVRDAFTNNLQKHRLYLLMKRAFLRSQSQNTAMLEREGHAVDIYHLLQTLYLREDPQYALSLHEETMRACLAGKASPATILRTVGDRAAILGYMGRMQVAYQLMDKAADAANALGLQSLRGYLALQRALLLDYMRSRNEEVADNLRKAVKYLSPVRDRLWMGMLFEYKLYRELLKGDFPALQTSARQVPENMPTRSWLSPRAIAITFFGLLLCGSRDAIVAQGEVYLERRRQVSARTHDLFIWLINVMLTFAKGEIDKTRKYFMVAMEEFCRGHEREFLYPFEEDFVSLFAYTFPPLFEQEYGRRLMRDAEMNQLLLRLRSRVWKIRGEQRDIPQLLRARSDEVLGRVRLNRRYDAALRAAKTNGAGVVQVFAYLWFGDFLLREGRQAPKDYLRRAHHMAVKVGARAVVEYAEKLMDARKITYEKAALTRQVSEAHQRAQVQMPELVQEHLGHVCDVLEVDTALEVNLEESLAVLLRQYRTTRATVVVSGRDGRPRILYPDESMSHHRQVAEYVTPYLNIRSTLFLPLRDAPWSGESEIRHRPGLNTALREATEEQGDMDATIVLGDDGPAGDATIADDTIVGKAPVAAHDHLNVSAMGNSALETIGGSVAGGISQSLRMSALIPIRSAAGSFGIVFLEEVNLSRRDTTACRLELDAFGQQLGLLFGQKAGSDFPIYDDQNAGSPVYVHNPANYTLEPVEWLRLWHRGKLRAGRETGWYFGLNYGAGHYLLVYCRLNGSQGIRERLSRMLWYHLQVMRALATASGRTNFEVNEIRDELVALLRSIDQSRELESLSLTFTLFDREGRWAYSGHFGPSRPIVFCQENRVRPQNDIIVSMLNGRDLRYWSVVAPMTGLHLYLLTHDTSKLEVNPSDNTLRSLKATLAGEGTGESLFRIVEELVHVENVPRYYIAAVQRSGEEQELEDGEESGFLPKAQ